jgi:hypothetical protein
MDEMNIGYFEYIKNKFKHYEPLYQVGGMILGYKYDWLGRKNIRYRCISALYKFL